MSQEIPLMTWRTGRGFNGYISEKQFQKYRVALSSIEFVCFAGGYLLVRFSSFFGDETFQWWDGPVAVGMGVVGIPLFTQVLIFTSGLNQGQAIKLYADRIESKITTGKGGGSVTFATFFSDVVSGTVTRVTQKGRSFLLVDLELKPDPGTLLTRKGRIYQFGIPAEVDSGAILKAFEQNHVPLTNH